EARTGIQNKVKSRTEEKQGKNQVGIINNRNTRRNQPGCRMSDIADSADDAMLISSKKLVVGREPADAKEPSHNEPIVSSTLVPEWIHHRPTLRTGPVASGTAAYR